MQSITNVFLFNLYSNALNNISALQNHEFSMINVEAKIVFGVTNLMAKNSYLYRRFPASYRFSFFVVDTLVEFQADLRMCRMEPLAEPPVWLFAFFAFVYVSVAYGSSCNNHVRSFFPKSWIHYQSL